jgi:hypothetical protein
VASRETLLLLRVWLAMLAALAVAVWHWITGRH